MGSSLFNKLFRQLDGSMLMNGGAGLAAGVGTENLGAKIDGSAVVAVVQSLLRFLSQGFETRVFTKAVRGRIAFRRRLRVGGGDGCGLMFRRGGLRRYILRAETADEVWRDRD